MSRLLPMMGGLVVAAVLGFVGCSNNDKLDEGDAKNAASTAKDVADNANDNGNSSGNEQANANGNSDAAAMAVVVKIENTTCPVCLNEITERPENRHITHNGYSYWVYCDGCADFARKQPENEGLVKRFKDVAGFDLTTPATDEEAKLLADSNAANAGTTGSN